MAPLIVAAALSAVDWAPPPPSLISPPQTAAKARDLVRRLGSPDYRERRSAHRALERLGRHALPALSAGLHSPDAEVRHRCRLLLPAARAADFEARAVAFRTDEAGYYRHDLPGWAELRAWAGDGRESRRLFVALLEPGPNRELVEAIGQGEAELARRVVARWREIYDGIYPRGSPRPPRVEPTLLDAAGLLLCEAILGDEVLPNGGTRLYPAARVMGRSKVRSAVESDPLGPAVRALAFAWCESRRTADGLYDAMTMAARLNVGDRVGYAARLIETGGSTAYRRAGAAVTIARYGDKADAPALLPLFDDRWVVVRASKTRPEVQVRDAALAMAALLVGRDPTELGLQARSTSSAGRYSYSNYSFPTNEDREKGFAKWAELEPGLRPEPGDPGKD